MPIYNKLVRDHIPAIISKSGKQVITRKLTLDDQFTALQQKLAEELDEYRHASDNQSALEELADMLEVMRYLTLLHGANWDQLESLREQKASERGGFQDGIFLIEVVDE